jgi:adenosylhomocysteine nucleosidase
MRRIALIAAMERELAPFVKGWARTLLKVGGRFRPCYENADLVAITGGIGVECAEATARAVIDKYQPEMLVSVGLAGALVRSLKVASIVVPNVIVDAASEREYRCFTEGDVIGGGVLVSAGEIAGGSAKVALAERFHALIVDMEAAGVAKVTQEKGTGFRCVKAISDPADFKMPPLNRFVNDAGEFQHQAFAAWIVVRPQYWSPTIVLGRNSARASRALCEWLNRNLAKLQPARVVTLDKAEYLNS